MDNVTLNLIICIKEPGTFILHENEIIQLKKGYGYLIIGAKMYEYGFNPTYHTAPLNIQDERCVISVICLDIYKEKKLDF